MSIPRSMFYGSTAIRDEPELPDYESESDLSNIDENEIMKQVTIVMISVIIIAFVTMII